MISVKSAQRLVIKSENKNQFHRPVSGAIRKPQLLKQSSPSISTDAPTAVIVNKPKTSRQQKLIVSALNKHCIFSNLPQDHKNNLINHMKLYTLFPHEFVFMQGNPGTHFFVVASGKLEVLVNKKRVALLKAEDNFGQLALIHGSPRSASVKTIEKSTLWGLDRRSFKLALKSLNRLKYNQNRAFIESVPEFRVLRPFQKETLLQSFSTFTFRPGQVIVHEGDSGELFYLIKEGRVECSKSFVLVRELREGEYFGEQALLQNSVRTATVTAVTQVKCVAVGYQVLNQMFGSFQTLVYKNSTRIALDKNKTMSNFHKEQKNQIVNRCQFSKFLAGQVVIQGQELIPSQVWIVIRGKIEKDGKIYKRFSCINQKLSTQNSHVEFAATFVAVGECVVAHIGHQDLKKCIGWQSGVRQVNLEAFSVIKRVQLFRGLPVLKLQQILACLQVYNFGTGQMIVEQDTEGGAFFIIKSGTVQVTKDGHVLRTEGKLDYFGERSLLFNQPRTASVIAQESVVCWGILQEQFQELFDDHIKAQLVSRIQLQDDSVQMKNLGIVKQIGKGSFGSVYQAYHKDDQRLYALKVINKRKLEYYQMEQNVILQRDILLLLDHTFIVKLVKTFKDNKRLYFLQQLVQGKQFFDVLQELDRVNEENTKFYGACLVLIIQHLHQRNIMYRDLKPENIMIDLQGYPKLIDFGISKILTGRTYTVIGTPHYMAPEILSGKGYYLPVDYYALGCVLYECLVGDLPFGSSLNDPYSIYEEVLQKKVRFPQSLKLSYECKDCILQLLNKDPYLRVQGGVENLREIPWFRDVMWDDLVTREYQPFYTPQIYRSENELKKAVMIGDTVQQVISRDKDNSFKKKVKSRVANENWDKDFQQEKFQDWKLCCQWFRKA